MKCIERQRQEQEIKKQELAKAIERNEKRRLRTLKALSKNRKKTRQRIGNYCIFREYNNEARRRNKKLKDKKRRLHLVRMEHQQEQQRKDEERRIESKRKDQARKWIINFRILRELNEDTLSDTHCISSSESTLSNTFIPPIPQNSFKSLPDPVQNHSLSNNDLPPYQFLSLTNTNKQINDDDTEHTKSNPPTTPFSSPENNNPNDNLYAITMPVTDIALEHIPDCFPDAWNGHVPTSVNILLINEIFMTRFSSDFNAPSFDSSHIIFNHFTNKDTAVSLFAALCPRSPPSEIDPSIADDAPTQFHLSFYGHSFL